MPYGSLTISTLVQTSHCHLWILDCGSNRLEWEIASCCPAPTVTPYSPHDFPVLNTFPVLLNSVGQLVQFAKAQSSEAHHVLQQLKRLNETNFVIIHNKSV